MLVGLALVDPHHPYDMAIAVPWHFREFATQQISVCCCIVNADSLQERVYCCHWHFGLMEFQVDSLSYFNQMTLDDCFRYNGKLTDLAVERCQFAPSLLFSCFLLDCCYAMLKVSQELDD